MGDGSFCNDDQSCYHAGACCLDEFTCAITLLEECISSDGTYMGDGSFCNADQSCYNAGACCVDDITCGITLLDDCLDYGGRYAGNGTVCAADLSCPEEYTWGACCISNGCLTLMTEECNQFNGLYQGDGSFCDDADVQCVASETCDADLDGDGAVKVSDLLLLIAAWGACP